MEDQSMLRLRLTDQSGRHTEVSEETYLGNQGTCESHKGGQSED